jgi:hypothetical protein
MGRASPQTTSRGGTTLLVTIAALFVAVLVVVTPGAPDGSQSQAAATLVGP